MSLFRKSNPQLPGEPNYHPVWSNFYDLFLTNFKLIPFFLPSLICLFLFLFLGGLVFLLAGLLFLLPAAPAIAAMYDLGYQLTREVDKHERRTFFQSYKLNCRQSMATMAVQLPFIGMLILVMLTSAERPVWITLCVMLGCILLMTFGALAFSQIALVDLPLGKLWQNAILLIPLCSWRGILVAVVQLVFIALLYQYIAVTFLLYLFAGPAVLIVWSSKTLWPKLEELLLDSED